MEIVKKNKKRARAAKTRHPKRATGAVIEDAIHALSHNRLHLALRSVFAALDETAQLSYPNLSQVGDRIKTFVRDNMELITRFSIPGGGVIIGRLRFQLHHPEIADDKGLVDFEDIVYHLMRCSLSHTTNVDDMIEFVDRWEFGCHNGTKLTVTKHLAIGLIAAIVAAPVNKDQKGPSCGFTIFGVDLQINDLWGRRDLWIERDKDIREAIASRPRS